MVCSHLAEEDDEDGEEEEDDGPEDGEDDGEVWQRWRLRQGRVLPRGDGQVSRLMVHWRVCNDQGGRWWYSSIY